MSCKMTEQTVDQHTQADHKDYKSKCRNHADWFDAKGCKHCNNLGYIERIGVFEILCLDEQIKHMIASGETAMDIRTYSMEHTDYKPLIVDAVNKCLEGVTTISEIEKKIVI